MVANRPIIEHPFYPIIYIRGYAGNQAGVEATAATPYMGFNVGSTKLRQYADQKPERLIFESPLVRLAKDHGYWDVYDSGDVVAEDDDIPSRSVWIFRYYDQVSEELSDDPNRPEIEEYAKQLAKFLNAIRDRICGSRDDASPEVASARDAFRVYLVAHSMGGLIARCYLQNEHVAAHYLEDDDAVGDEPVKVDKVFTYGTPHGGIDMKLVGNLLTHFPVNNAENFNRRRMAQYLALSNGADVRELDGKYPPERFFCFIGTNHNDYGLPRHVVGAMSDGLVRIDNAAVSGAPRAFSYRSHSGDYGIVNSEEGYQNLRRFLFGQHRVDALLEIDDVTLPPEVWDEADAGKKIEASYHFEVIAKVRGTRWDLHRRTVSEESARFVKYDRIKKKRPITLASTFLLTEAKVVDPADDPTLGFSLDVGLRVPEYRVDGFLWMDNYYEGGYVFRDKFNFELTPGSPPLVRIGRDSRTPNRVTQPLEASRTLRSGWKFSVPIEDSSHPRLEGTLLIRSFPWNRRPMD